MTWKKYRLANNIIGWFAFAIALVTYLLTIGHSASLWDCAEFIVSANKLEIAHPPGAPFFMLVYNVFSNFTSDPTQIGLLCNATSALLSALTILFLFWTTTHLVRRVVAPKYEEDSLSLGQGLIILGAGLVAALAYTFTDTFWFSAVEAEVYAFSSLFTAVVFWLMFVWDDRADNERSDRWLILIAYLMGLSIGVHLLNLLCIPAMGLIYYYRKAKTPNWKGGLLALFLSFVLIVLMMYGVIQGVPKVGGLFDLFFVNTLGLPYNSGLYAYLLTLAACLVWGIYETGRSVKEGKTSLRMRLSLILSILLVGIPFMKGIWLGVVLIAAFAIWLFRSKKVNIKLMHTVQLCLAVIMVGFASYGVILVRAGTHPPMNENDPSDAFSLDYYLARKQYGSRPLFLGATFAARPTSWEYKKAYKQIPDNTGRGKHKYVKQNEDVPELEYDSDDLMLFPRVHSANPNHIRAYNVWMGRAPEDNTKPTFGENLKFFFDYQVGYMYFRYFGWNFMGRLNDLPGDGGYLNGLVATGIGPIDRAIIGPTDDMPDFIAKNKGHNVYYMLPFLLGLIGIAFQLFTREKRGTQTFWVVFWLFIMTGLAIIVYLNQPPGEPRERDYAYAGSFYAYCIWMGFGVVAIWKGLQKIKLKSVPAAALATGLTILIPIQMASQNWDDHDRSGRSAARDFGRNFLESCDENAILFTYGDNDTFPLWYCQEVEGIRTDVRVANLSYMGADWYIDQMKQQAYDSAPLPLDDLQPDFYYKHSYLMVRPDYTMPLGEAIRTTFREYAPGADPYFPADVLIYDVDSLAAAKAFADDTIVSSRILTEMPLSLKNKQGIGRAEMAVLDIIYRNNWERPIYWAISTPTTALSNLNNYLRQTGLAYQLVPTKIDNASARYNVERMYSVFMDKFKFGGAENPRTYFSQDARLMARAYRYNVAIPLAESLMNQGDVTRARNVLEKCYKGIRTEVVPYAEFQAIIFAEMLYEVGMIEEADLIIEELCQTEIKSLNWYLRLSLEKLSSEEIASAMQSSLENLYSAIQIASSKGSPVVDKYRPDLDRLLMLLVGSAQE